MNVLDENIPRDQADLLNQWNIRFRSISRDLGYQGIEYWTKHTAALVRIEWP